MFRINEDGSIYVTRGDIVAFTVTAKDNGKNHKFQPGDVLRIKVFGKKDAETVVLQKDFPVLSVTEKVEIYLTEDETRIGEVISKPKDYWYEVELNPYDNPQTIIGYDEDGAKVFRLFPEGDEVPAYIPVPEEIPVVDAELDLTSTRPVQNQAVARAFRNLEDGYERTHAAVAERFVTPKMYGAIGDGEADDTDALQQALTENRDVYIPEGVYMIRTSTDDTAEYNDGEGIGVEIPSNTRLVLHPNAVLKGIPNKSSRYRVLWATDSENIYISGGRIECDKESATGEHGHGLVIRRCTNVTIENMTISNALGDCLCISGMADSVTENEGSKGVVIRGCELYGSRRQGITIGKSDGVLVDACYIHDVGGIDPQSGIDIEVDDPETSTATNIKINNCRFENNVNYDIIASTYGVVEVIGCKCSNRIWNERGKLTVKNSEGAIYHYNTAQSTDIIGCVVPVLYSYGENCRCVGSVVRHVWTNNKLTIENSTVVCEGLTHGIQPYQNTDLVFNNCHIFVKNCKYGVNGNRAIFNQCVIDVTTDATFQAFAYLAYGEFNGCVFSIDNVAKDLAYANGTDARVKFLGCKFLTDFFISINASSVKYRFVGNILCVEPSALLANTTYVHDNFNAY